MRLDYFEIAMLANEGVDGGKDHSVVQSGNDIENGEEFCGDGCYNFGGK